MNGSNQGVCMLVFVGDHSGYLRYMLCDCADEIVMLRYEIKM